MKQKIEEFIKESNGIEGILDYMKEKQYDAYMRFLSLDEISINDLLDLGQELQETSEYESTPVDLRDKHWMNVRVGNYYPPKGGPKLKKKLEELLERCNESDFSESLSIRFKQAFEIHCEYESIHPFTDCNGRTGRAVWLWIMMKFGYKMRVGFLQRWYYQSLDQFRS